MDVDVIGGLFSPLFSFSLGFALEALFYKLAERVGWPLAFRKWLRVEWCLSWLTAFAGGEGGIRTHGKPRGPFGKRNPYKIRDWRR